MTDYLEIEGDLVRHIRREVVLEAPLTDVMPLIETRKPVTTPLLPDRTRFFHLDPSSNDEWWLSILVELPAQVRTIHLSPGRWPNDQLNPRLAMPNTVFAFHVASYDQGQNWGIENYECFHTKMPLTGSGAQTLLPAMLPNIYDRGEICFGDTGPRLPADAHFSTRINGTVNEFYLTNFADHRVRTHYIPGHDDPEHPDYAGWIEATNTNPRCWENWTEFDQAPGNVTIRTVDDVLSMGQEGEGRRRARTTPIMLPNAIPELAFHPTFGRAAEWVAELNDQQRRTLAPHFAPAPARRTTRTTANA